MPTFTFLCTGIIKNFFDFNGRETFTSSCVHVLVFDFNGRETFTNSCVYVSFFVLNGRETFTSSCVYVSVLIGNVLLKVKANKVNVIVITPSWPVQLWHSQFLQLSVAEPLLLPQLSNILVNPQGQVHSLVVNKTLRLVAWKFSGRARPRKEFRQGLQSLSQVPEDQAHHLITNWPSVNELAGVVNKKLIRIHAI